MLGVVIVVDASRAMLSFRAAREHHSAALESNALHFASDLLGTLAVLIGLGFVAAGEPRADASPRSSSRSSCSSRRGGS